VPAPKIRSSERTMSERTSNRLGNIGGRDAPLRSLYLLQDKITILRKTERTYRFDFRPEDSRV
jgi:hypothetical protein